MCVLRKNYCHVPLLILHFTGSPFGGDLFNAFGPSPFSDSESRFGSSFGGPSDGPSSPSGPSGDGELLRSLPNPHESQYIPGDSQFDIYSDEEKPTKRQLTTGPGFGESEGDFAVPPQFKNLGTVSEPAGLANAGEFKVCGEIVNHCVY